MLQSERLLLRAIDLYDIDFMYEVENDTDAWKYSDNIAPLSFKILKDYALSYDADPFKAQQLRLIIVAKEIGNKPVGIIDLYDISQRHSRAFIGIYICPVYRCKGYASEALALIEEYACNSLLLHQVAAKVDEDNEKSVNIFENRNYKIIGKMDDWIKTPHGKYCNQLLLAKKL